ncbi:hypothetical protein CWR48_04900 [Oceanobacillus arenosus]|uniref:Uncharacterized protein n=1 Tax=Oceanobacillus arenosus TaxID=1229153 RepID=A0A3D8PZ88_9BACI|nr:ABC transporter permease subunit [Oceanobacillus arenosus]RDW20065.1 hypothetical protein CWR48_04900 [Oceanobacillus arenosus]
MKSIQYEWKKLWKSKAYIALIVITMLIIAGLFYRNVVYQDIVKSEKIETVQSQSTWIVSYLSRDRELLKETGEGSNPDLEESIALGSQLNGKLQDLLAAIQEDEHITALHVENDVYALAMQYQTMSDNKSYPISKVEMEDEITLNNELLKKKLPKEDLGASIQPAVFMKQVVQYLFNTFGFFIVIVVIGTPIVREFDDNTIKLTYGLPVSPVRMIMTKWISITLSGICWFVIALLSAYAISTIFGTEETNPYDYPFFTEKMAFITAGDYLQQSIILGIFYLLLLMSLFVFLSFLIKNTLVVHITLLILFVCNYIVIRSGIIFPFLPWVYQELDAATLQSNGISWTGFLLMIVFTGVLLLLAIRASKRREYRR